MMNKKIFIPLIVVAVVAVSAGVYGFDQTNSNYNPFADAKYADNISTMTYENPWKSYTGDKSVKSISGVFEALSLQEIVNLSDLIISGSIKDIEYVEEATNPDAPEDITVSTIYTVTIHSYMKGTDSDGVIKYTVAGGETKNHITIFEDMFVFEKRDQVVLMLEKFSTVDGEILYSAMTDMGAFKVTNGGPNSGEVQQIGESITIPLPEFKSLIRGMID